VPVAAAGVRHDVLALRDEPPPLPLLLIWLSARQVDPDGGRGGQAVVDGAVFDHGLQGRSLLCGKGVGHPNGQVDIGDAGGPVGGHPVGDGDAEPFAGEAVAGQVAPSVECHARG
jgi:hypothetical protein